MTIYISNLNSVITVADLNDLFSKHGEVTSVEIAIDVISGESRGFGYVEMKDRLEAQKAIAALNRTEFHDLTISLQEEKREKTHS